MSVEISTAKLVDGYNYAFVDSTKEVDESLAPHFVFNGGDMTVRDVIVNELNNCSDFFMSVAFITSGGLVPFLGYLSELDKNGRRGKILTTDYLMFSDPAALDKISSLKNIELKMFKTQSAGVGFHTKGYLFHNNDGSLRILVGSSNLTQNAISRNHEWNTLLVSKSEGKYAQEIVSEFDSIWNSPFSVNYSDYREEYSQGYKDKSRERETLKNITSVSTKIIVPNSMQQEFCLKIEKLVEDGQKKALLISATGTGKTYASAFAIRKLLANKKFNGKRVLFLSHRDQINRQSIESYKKVLGDNRTIALLSGDSQDWGKIVNAQFVFSTVQMMSKDDIRASYFPAKNHFAIIIVDECHHVGASSYQKILDYFQPDFQLGMTATPERNGDFDIFDEFDHNIACEIRLQTALENELLCPFHYFGIADLKIDGKQVDLGNFSELTSDEMVRQIIRQARYYGFSGDKVRGVVFCHNIKESKELSLKFNNTGFYKTIALSGENSPEERLDAVKRLTYSTDSPDYLDYIFTVDIFNEGVDIPEINQVIMLRPTESAIVFVQQLGRGLRKSKDKEFVVIIDFIGNYNNSYLIPIALFGDRTGNKDNVRKDLSQNKIKGISSIFFDKVAKERIFRSIDETNLTTSRLLKEEYANFKMKLGRRPKLIEFDLYKELDPLRMLSVVKSYHEFLVKYDGLTETYTEKQNIILWFLSNKLMSGKRDHELQLLKLILENPESKDLRADWLKQVGKSDILTVESVYRVLSGEFYATGSNKEELAKIKFMETDSYGCWTVDEEFKGLLSDDSFRADVEEIIEFGLNRNLTRYSDGKGSSFVIGEKYTYEDVCRLLCWRNNMNAQLIGGYKFDSYTNTFPVFINYEKSSDVSDTNNYNDRFESRERLIAISKSKRTMASNDIRQIIDSKENSTRLPLFVRKNKNDKGGGGKEFYYLGEIIPNGFLKEFVMPNTKGVTAVEIGYDLKTPVEPRLYEYITSNIE